MSTAEPSATRYVQTERRPATVTPPPGAGHFRGPCFVRGEFRLGDTVTGYLVRDLADRTGYVAQPAWIGPWREPEPAQVINLALRRAARLACRSVAP